MIKTAFSAALMVSGTLGLAAAPAAAQDMMDKAKSGAKSAAKSEAKGAAKDMAGDMAPGMPALTIDSSIESLMANAATSAILEKYLPGIGSHSAYDQFKGMSLVELKPWSGGLVTDDVIAKVTSELANLG